MELKEKKQTLKKQFDELNKKYVTLGTNIQKAQVEQNKMLNDLIYLKGKIEGLYEIEPEEKVEPVEVKQVEKKEEVKETEKK